MTNPRKTIATAVGVFFILILLAPLPAITVYIDLTLLQNDVGETSLTEFVQEIMLLLSSSIFFYGAWRHPDKRGFLLLASGLFLSMFIRELDYLFDRITHGFWVYPASLTALTCILVARFFCRGTTLQPLARFINTRPYLFILIGLITLLAFSRTFGSSSLLWSHVFPQEVAPGFKAAIQEGPELYGYGLILFGSFLMFLGGYETRKQIAPSSQKMEDDAVSTLTLSPADGAC